MAWARHIVSIIVLLGGIALMFRGDDLWRWAAGMPQGDERLLAAIAGGDISAARGAIARGANVNAPSDLGMLPLAIASDSGDEAMVTFLIGQGAELDAPSQSCCPPVSYAAMCGHTKVIRILLDAGADLNGRHRGGPALIPPLVAAIIAGHEEAAEILLKFGADPNLCGDGENRWSPLTAAAASEFVSKRFLKVLIDAGANVNAVDRTGSTPLAAALRAGNSDVASALRSAGATS